MCIIAAKPAGVKMPDMDTIEVMWHANPDGAGLMYPTTQTAKVKGKKTTTKVVQIEKGFMKLADFRDRLIELGKSMDLTATPVVMHFRITTHGGTCPENTHPFPVTDSVGALQKRRCTANLGVAHNGIIHSVTPRKGISDTMEYIASQLAPLHKALPRWWENKHAVRMVENAIDSKMAILTPEGDIRLIGKFNEDNGIQYSNTSYIEDVYDHRYGMYGCGGWDWRSFSEYSGEVDNLNPSVRYLCYLDEFPGAYAQEENGDLVDGADADLAMATDKTVYWYDGEIGYWVPTAMTAFNANGLTLRYDYEKAVREECLTAAQADAWYAFLSEEENNPAEDETFF